MAAVEFDQELDARGAKCPMPIVKARQQLGVGQVLKVVATDPGSVLDFQGWAKTARNIELVAQESARDATGAEVYIHYVRRSA